MLTLSMSIILAHQDSHISPASFIYQLQTAKSYGMLSKYNTAL